MLYRWPLLQSMLIWGHNLPVPFFLPSKGNWGPGKNATLFSAILIIKNFVFAPDEIYVSTLYSSLAHSLFLDLPGVTELDLLSLPSNSHFGLKKKF